MIWDLGDLFVQPAEIAAIEVKYGGNEFFVRFTLKGGGVVASHRTTPDGARALFNSVVREWKGGPQQNEVVPFV